MKHFIVLLVITTLAGCSYLKSNPNRKSADDLVSQAKNTCTQLGYVPGTKEYVDCSTAQFNKLQENHYGPLQ